MMHQQIDVSFILTSQASIFSFNKLPLRFVAHFLTMYNQFVLCSLIGLFASGVRGDRFSTIEEAANYVDKFKYKTSATTAVPDSVLESLSFVLFWLTGIVALRLGLVLLGGLKDGLRSFLYKFNDNFTLPEKCCGRNFHCPTKRQSSSTDGSDGSLGSVCYIVCSSMRAILIH